jgi:hypothetical protein
MRPDDSEPVIEQTSPFERKREPVNWPEIKVPEMEHPLEKHPIVPGEHIYDPEKLDPLCVMVKEI